MAEDNKITLNETHPNAFSTIREDLETISNEAVYWTDFDGIIDEIYPDTFQQKLIEIESELNRIRDFVGANYVKDEDGNVGNSFDVRLTQAEVSLNRRPILSDKPADFNDFVNDFETDEDGNPIIPLPDPNDFGSKLFNLEQEFDSLKQKFDYFKNKEDFRANIVEFRGLVEELRQLKDAITDLEAKSEFKLNVENEIKDARVSTFGSEEEKTLGERLDKDFQYLHDLIKDVNYNEFDGYNIQADETIAGWTKNLTLEGRTDYNVVLGDTSECQVIPIIPEDAKDKAVRSVEVKGSAVNVGTIQGYTYTSLMGEDGKDVGGISPYTPPRSVSYLYEGTKEDQYISMGSVEGATIQDVVISTFEPGTVMPFLPSDGEYSTSNNKTEGQATLGSIRGKSVKNEILNGETSIVNIGLKPDPTTNTIMFDSETIIHVGNIHGNMIENVIIGDSYSESDLPVEDIYEELAAGDRVYIDRIDGKTVVNLLSNCDTSPEKTEVTSRLNARDTLFNSPERIIPKEGRFKEFTIEGNTMKNIGLEPDNSTCSIFGNSFVPHEQIEGYHGLDTKINSITIKGRVYENVLKPIGETDTVDVIANGALELDNIIDNKYGWIKIEPGVNLPEIRVCGNGKSVFTELRSYYDNGEYDSIRPIKPQVLLSKGDVYDEIDINGRRLIQRLEIDGSGNIVEKATVEKSTIELYRKDDIVFYNNINLDGDIVQNVYNIVEEKEYDYLHTITFDGNSKQLWSLKATAQNKVNTIVFRYQLPPGIETPTDNNTMAIFESNMFKKSTAGNSGTNAVDEEAISINRAGYLELRISKTKIGAESSDTNSDLIIKLRKFLEKNKLVVTVKFENPIVHENVSYDTIKDKYDFTPNSRFDIQVQNGYKFEAVTNSDDPCRLIMKLPTYNRYPVPSDTITEIYTLVLKGNYLNGNLTEYIDGNKVLTNPKVIYLRDKEYDVMLLKGDLHEVDNLNTRYFEYGEKVSIDMKDAKLNVNGKQLDVVLDKPYKDLNLTTMSEISITGCDDEIAEFEINFDSLFDFNVIGNLNKNNGVEYTVVELGEEQYRVVVSDIKDKHIHVDTAMHRPMLFEGRYDNTYFRQYFDGMLSVENPVFRNVASEDLEPLTIQRIMRGFKGKDGITEYRDSYNFITKEFNRNIGCVIIDGNTPLVPDGESRYYNPGTKEWTDGRLSKEAYMISDDNSYVLGNHIYVDPNFDFSKGNIEVLYVLKDTEVASKDDFTNFPVPVYDGGIIDIEGSIVPPKLIYKTHSYNYFENVKGLRNGESYMITSECKGEGQLLIGDYPIGDLSSLDTMSFTLNFDVPETVCVRAVGFEDIRNLTLYEDFDGSEVFGVEGMSSIGDNNVIEIYAEGRNKLNIHDLNKVGIIDIRDDLVLMAKDSKLTSQLHLKDRDYLLSFTSLIGSGKVSLLIDGMTAIDVEFSEGDFNYLIEKCNILDIAIVSDEDETMLINLQLAENDGDIEFEPYYRSGYSIKLASPLMSIGRDCKDILEISPDSYYDSFVRRRIGRLVANKWVETEDGSAYKCNIGVILNKFISNYSIFEVRGNELFIDKYTYLTLELDKKPLVIIYELEKTELESVVIEPMNIVFNDGIIISNNKNYTLKIHEIN